MLLFDELVKRAKECKSSTFQIGKYGYGVLVAIGLLFINLVARGQEYDARIDVTFIKADSSETRYLSLINYSNQAIELNLVTDECLFFDDSKIISIKEGSLSLSNASPRGYSHYITFGAGLDYISNSCLVIYPLSVLLVPIKEPKSNYNDEIYFALVVPNATSISLNNKKEEEGYPGKRLISFRRTFYGITYKPAVYDKLQLIPFSVNLNRTLTAKPGFSKAINKTTVLGLREYLSYFCE